MTWLLKSEELDAPEDRHQMGPASTGMARRQGLLQDLVIEVVHASPTPISRSGVTSATRGLLASGWAEVEASEIAEAVEEALMDASDVGFDGSGRVFSRRVGPAPVRAAQALRAAVAIATQLSDLEVIGLSSSYYQAKQMTAAPLLSHEATLRLSRAFHRGDLAAKQRLVESNTRLVVSIARRWGFAKTASCSFEDMFQNGCLGLIRAAEKFDPDRGHRFSTYATWWIKQAISRGIDDQSRTIRLPVHVSEKLRKIRAARYRLEREIGRAPTDEEISKAAGVEPEEVEPILRAAQVPLSLEHDARAPIVHDQSASPLEEVSQSLIGKELRSAMEAHLSYRERKVIELYYGLGGQPPQTLDGVGRTFNVTRERVRQIQGQALKKLATLAELQELRAGDDRLRGGSPRRIWTVDLLIGEPWRIPIGVSAPEQSSEEGKVESNGYDEEASEDTEG